jgi:hypothetical protein
MKKTPLIFIFCLVAMIFSSCSFYNPISTNVPSYEKKGEVNLGVNLGTSADVQVSANPINHLSIIGTASISGSVSNETGVNNSEPDSLRFTYHRNQFELGIGYYYKLTDKIQHDFHIGYGIAAAAEKEDAFSDDNTYAYRADVTNFFIQSSLIIELDTDLKGFLSSKFNYLSISNYRESFERSIFGIPQGSRSFNEESFWLSQFGAGFIGDLGPLQITGQAQLNFRFTNNLFLDERPIGVYVGVNFNLSEIIEMSKQRRQNE